MGALQCHCLSFSGAVLKVIFGVFVRIALWSLVFARVGVALLFESLLGLVVGVCGCAVCLCLAVFSQFSPINWTLSS
jgi:hypothetical protein